MVDLSVVHDPRGHFSVLLNNRTGAWKIVEGMHSLDDLEPLAEDMQYRIRPRDYRVITVFLNNNCNLRCDYCRFDKVTHHGIEHGSLDLKAVVRSIRGLCLPGEQVDIHFQGGEPLLRVADIEQVCSELSAADVPFRARFHVTTNGTVLTPSVLRILKTYGIGVTLSIDGLPEVHDRHRKFANGLGSFSRVRRTLELLRTEGIAFGVFCVVSEPENMRAMHDYLVDEIGLTTFVLAPLEIDGERTSEELDRYLAHFFAEQVGILERNIDRYLRDGIKVREYLGELLLWGKVSPGFYSKACGDSPRSACGSRMHSVERNGDIRPCQNARMVFDEGPEHIEACLGRAGICERCDFRAHCSTPICFTRLAPVVVRGFQSGDAGARSYVETACNHLKQREMTLFDLLYRRKQDVLDYLAH